MHPRDLYQQPLDFLELAKLYPALKPLIRLGPNGYTLNFRDPVTQRVLTEALLHRDFGISLTIPPDRLCPPVPNRLNYILWLQDILDAQSLTTSAEGASGGQIVSVIDIGTGASAIYPLLGCRINPQWRFVATDIDDASLRYARLNVTQNAMQDRITIVPVNPSGSILPISSNESNAKLESSPEYDFTMCNPPFYGSREEVLRSAEAKQLGPNAVCTGADVEMITPGGESAFVCTMVRESIRSRTRCRWYTSMLGKMSSLSDVVKLLREEHIENYAITEFVQGQTRRWAIGWSFGNIHLPDSIARISNPALQGIMPPRNTLRQSFSHGRTVQDLKTVLHGVLASIDGVFLRASPEQRYAEPRLDMPDVVAHAAGNTWSRAARRRKLATTNSEESPMELTSGSAELVVRIRCMDEPVVKIASDYPTILEFDWLRGNDRALFESFVSHVGRKVGAALVSARQ